MTIDNDHQRIVLDRHHARQYQHRDYEIDDDDVSIVYGDAETVYGHTAFSDQSSLCPLDASQRSSSTTNAAAAAAAADATMAHRPVMGMSAASSSATTATATATRTTVKRTRTPPSSNSNSNSGSVKLMPREERRRRRREWQRRQEQQVDSTFSTFEDNEDDTVTSSTALHLNDHRKTQNCGNSIDSSDISSNEDEEEDEDNTANISSKSDDATMKAENPFASLQAMLQKESENDDRSSVSTRSPQKQSTKAPLSLPTRVHHQPQSQSLSKTTSSFPEPSLPDFASLPQDDYSDSESTEAHCHNRHPNQPSPFSSKPSKQRRSVNTSSSLPLLAPRAFPFSATSPNVLPGGNSSTMSSQHQSTKRRRTMTSLSSSSSMNMNMSTSTTKTMMTTKTKTQQEADNNIVGLRPTHWRRQRTVQRLSVPTGFLKQAAQQSKAQRIKTLRAATLRRTSTSSKAILSLSESTNSHVNSINRNESIFLDSKNEEKMQKENYRQKKNNNDNMGRGHKSLQAPSITTETLRTMSFRPATMPKNRNRNCELISTQEDTIISTTNDNESENENDSVHSVHGEIMNNQTNNTIRSTSTTTITSPPRDKQRMDRSRFSSPTPPRRTSRKSKSSSSSGVWTKRWASIQSQITNQAMKLQYNRSGASFFLQDPRQQARTVTDVTLVGENVPNLTNYVGVPPSTSMSGSTDMSSSLLTMRAYLHCHQKNGCHKIQNPLTEMQNAQIISGWAWITISRTTLRTVGIQAKTSLRIYDAIVLPVRGSKGQYLILCTQLAEKHPGGIPSVPMETLNPVEEIKK